jgi:hypothetical protein
MAKSRWESSRPTPERIAVAAALTAHGEFKDLVIARRLGISVRTLARWRKLPEYIAAADAIWLIRFIVSSGVQYYQGLPHLGPNERTIDLFLGRQDQSLLVNETEEAVL